MSSRSLWAALNPGSCLTRPKIGVDADHHAHAEQREHDDRDPLGGAVAGSAPRRPASASRAPAYQPRSCMNGARSTAGSGGPSSRAGTARRCTCAARSRPPRRAAREVAGVQQQLGERRQHERRQRRAGDHREHEGDRRAAPASRTGRRAPRAAVQQSAEREEHREHEHQVEARLGMAAEGTAGRPPRRARRPGAVPVAGPASSQAASAHGIQRVHAGQRPCQPDDEERPEREHQPGHERPAEAHAEQRARTGRRRTRRGTASASRRRPATSRTAARTTRG